MMLKKDYFSAVRKDLLWAGLVLVVVSIFCSEDLILNCPWLMLVTTFGYRVLII